MLGVHCLYTWDVELLSGLENDLKLAVLFTLKWLRELYPYFYNIFEIPTFVFMCLQSNKYKLFGSVNFAFHLNILKHLHIYL